MSFMPPYATVVFLKALSAESTQIEPVSGQTRDGWWRSSSRLQFVSQQHPLWRCCGCLLLDVLLLLGSWREEKRRRTGETAEQCVALEKNPGSLKLGTRWGFVVIVIRLSLFYSTLAIRLHLFGSAVETAFYRTLFYLTVTIIPNTIEWANSVQTYRKEYLTFTQHDFDVKRVDQAGLRGEGGEGKRSFGL